MQVGSQQFRSSEDRPHPYRNEGRGGKKVVKKKSQTTETTEADCWVVPRPKVLKPQQVKTITGLLQREKGEAQDRPNRPKKTVARNLK